MTHLITQAFFSLLQTYHITSTISEILNFVFNIAPIISTVLIILLKFIVLINLLLIIKLLRYNSNINPIIRAFVVLFLGFIAVCLIITIIGDIRYDVLLSSEVDWSAAINESVRAYLYYMPDSLPFPPYGGEGSATTLAHYQHIINSYAIVSPTFSELMRGGPGPGVVNSFPYGWYMPTQFPGVTQLHMHIPSYDSVVNYSGYSPGNVGLGNNTFNNINIVVHMNCDLVDLHDSASGATYYEDSVD